MSDLWGAQGKVLFLGAYRVKFGYLETYVKGVIYRWNLNTLPDHTGVLGTELHILPSHTGGMFAKHFGIVYYGPPHLQEVYLIWHKLEGFCSSFDVGGGDAAGLLHWVKDVNRKDVRSRCRRSDVNLLPMCRYCISSFCEVFFFAKKTRSYSVDLL